LVHRWETGTGRSPQAWPLAPPLPSNRLNDCRGESEEANLGDHHLSLPLSPLSTQLSRGYDEKVNRETKRRSPVSIEKLAIVFNLKRSRKTLQQRKNCYKLRDCKP